MIRAFGYPSCVDEQKDSLGHFCGIVGLYSEIGRNLPHELFYSLYALQHRGQEAAGICYSENGKFLTYKGIGLVSQVLAPFLTQNHKANLGIGHVRYSTSGGTRVENAQPIHITCIRGDIALAHNGNISNIHSIRIRLTAEGAIFQTTSDTELVLHLLSRAKAPLFQDALVEVLRQLKGAFSMVLLHDETLYIFRDPQGFRPLYYGEEGGLHMAASETSAFDMVGITRYRQVECGEILILDKSGPRSLKYAVPKPSHCVFELIYFARPDSQIFGRSVYKFRKSIGRALAEVDPVVADLVLPVPDSGTTAALGYAEVKKIPFEMGMTRNHFAGRSFTLPKQDQRELAVRMKLHPIKDVIAGKIIVLVDDSLVRGTTSKIIVKLLKEAGAKEVHLRLSSPEIRFPCFYGIDIPTRKELISNRMDAENLAREIGADSVLFLPIQDLKTVSELPENYCFACFSGDYPEELSLENQKELTL